MDVNLRIFVNWNHLIDLDAIGPFDSTGDLNIPYAVFVTSGGDTVPFGTIESCRECGITELVQKLARLVDPDALERQAKAETRRAVRA